MRWLFKECSVHSLWVFSFFFFFLLFGASFSLILKMQLLFLPMNRKLSMFPSSSISHSGSQAICPSNFLCGPGAPFFNFVCCCTFFIVTNQQHRGKGMKSITLVSSGRLPPSHHYQSWPSKFFILQAFFSPSYKRFPISWSILTDNNFAMVSSGSFSFPFSITSCTKYSEQLVSHRYLTIFLGLMLHLHL